MPTYEFRCPEGHEFEKFYRSISGGEAAAACPICGKPAERMMSAAGFAFKGSGFYLTDYGKNAHRGEAPPDAKAAAAADGAPSAASEKPEGKKAEATAASGEGGKTDSSKTAEATKPAPEAKKSETKASEPKVKPAPTPKSSAGE